MNFRDTIVYLTVRRYAFSRFAFLPPFLARLRYIRRKEEYVRP